MASDELEDVQDWTGPGRLRRVVGAQNTGAPVLVTHGTFSNASTCVPIAQALGAARPAYVLEWRARNLGWGHRAHFDYTDLALGEIAQSVALLHKLHGAPVHFVGHSGGGLALVVALAAVPELAGQLGSVTIVAAQGTWQNPGYRNRLSVAVMERLGRHIGYWPKRFLPIGPCSEDGRLKSNWVAWTRAARMFDRGGADVLAQVKHLQVPALVLAGAADHDIAPAAACKVIADALDARFEVCGKATGHAEDFTHARIFKSRAAAQTVYPMIADWIAAH